MKITRSMFDAEAIELRVEDDKNTMFGTVVKYEKLSNPLPQLMGVREKVRKGAFTRTIKKNEVVAVWNHNTDMVLGNTRAGTLRLTETSTGLEFEIDLPDTQYGKDAAISVKRGDVRSVSFGFRKIKDEWDESDEKNIVRTLIDVDLIEISPTPSVIAAYPSSKVNMRSVKEDYEDYSEEKRAVAEEAQRVKDEEQAIINNLKLKQQRVAELEKDF